MLKLKNQRAQLKTKNGILLFFFSQLNNLFWSFMLPFSFFLSMQIWIQFRFKKYCLVLLDVLSTSVYQMFYHWSALELNGIFWSWNWLLIRQFGCMSNVSAFEFQNQFVRFFFIFAGRWRTLSSTMPERLYL